MTTKGDEMKQLTDEVFTQVRDALRPFAEDARGIHPDWSKERSRVSLTQDKPLTVGDFRKANAALAALDTAQPALSGCACRWDADDKRVATCVRHQGWLDVVSEWADRAKVAEAKLAQPPAPSEAAAQGQDLLEIMCARIKAADDAMADGDYMLDSDDCISVIRGTWKPPMLNDKPAAPTPQAAAQPPAPSDAAREYMTGYSDGREWAGATSQAQPSQAVELSDGEVMRCISESACYGTVRMSFESWPYSIDKPSLNATKFANAIIAAINAKERAAHGIKQGGQHD